MPGKVQILRCKDLELLNAAGVEFDQKYLLLDWSATVPVASLIHRKASETLALQS
jgi:hypothetical protein